MSHVVPISNWLRSAVSPIVDKFVLSEHLQGESARDVRDRSALAA
jgi:hypothetical protein